MFIRSSSASTMKVTVSLNTCQEKAWMDEDVTQIWIKTSIKFCTIG